MKCKVVFICVLVIPICFSCGQAKRTKLIGHWELKDTEHSTHMMIDKSDTAWLHAQDSVQPYIIKEQNGEKNKKSPLK